MKTQHILDHIQTLQQALGALATTFQQRLERTLEVPIKEQTPPDDDWGPSGFAAAHLDYLSVSLHRLADDLAALAAATDTTKTSTSSTTAEREARLLTNVDYIAFSLEQLEAVVAAETASGVQVRLPRNDSEATH